MHHQEISRHLDLFLELQNSLQLLRDEASQFGQENWEAILNLRSAVESLHTQLQSVDTGLFQFTQSHVALAIAKLTSQFKRQRLLDQATPVNIPP